MPGCWNSGNTSLCSFNVTNIGSTILLGPRISPRSWYWWPTRVPLRTISRAPWPARTKRASCSSSSPLNSEVSRTGDRGRKLHQSPETGRCLGVLDLGQHAIRNARALGELLDGETELIPCTRAPFLAMTQPTPPRLARRAGRQRVHRCWPSFLGRRSVTRDSPSVKSARRQPFALVDGRSAVISRWLPFRQAWGSPYVSRPRTRLDDLSARRSLSLPPWASPALKMLRAAFASGISVKPQATQLKRCS